MSHVRLYNWCDTYLLQSEKTNTWYTGTPTNLPQRLYQHHQGLVRSTRAHRPPKLINYEACQNPDDAYRRERSLKSGMGKRYLRNRLKRSLTG